MNLVTGLAIPFLGTTLGSAMVFFMKNKMNSKVEKLLLGFASGVMIAASIPSVCNPLTMASFPPTSIPSRNSSTHIRSVIILCIHVNRLLRRR